MCIVFVCVSVCLSVWNVCGWKSLHELWMLHGSLCLLSQRLGRLMETTVLLGMH